jgi:hypothetical protein
MINVQGTIIAIDQMNIKWFEQSIVSSFWDVVATLTWLIGASQPAEARHSAQRPANSIAPPDPAIHAGHHQGWESRNSDILIA